MATGDNYFKNTNIYAGADYGMDPNYGKLFSVGMGSKYTVTAGSVGITTDARSANQLRDLSKRLNTGAKTIEIQGVSAAELESIPEHHLTEIYRLKKLTGVDLTFHGPLVEPTGVTKQGWDETHREQAERQMWSAVKRAHKMDPNGNLVITFHSSNGLPNPVSTIINEETGQEEVKEFWIVDKHQGQFKPLTPKPDYFRSKDGKYKSAKEQIEMMKKSVDKDNKDTWFRQLQHVSFNAGAGANDFERVLEGEGMAKELREDFDKQKIFDFYKMYKEGKTGDIMKAIEGKPYKQGFQKMINDLVHGDNYFRDAYQELQGLFNQAYEVAMGTNNEIDLKKLNDYRGMMKNKLHDIEEPENVLKLKDAIIEGVNVLSSIRAPQAFTSMREFAIDKSADTFSNLAFNAYKEFKNTAPIISIENPPVGMGLARAKDLRDMVLSSREKLTSKFVEKMNMSENEARKQAEKLVGVTWDVGHINMLRKYGYGKEHVIEETKKVADVVKHVHLSDNFGMEHTELPMGMGNVPTKQMIEAIHQYNDKVKHIVETGGAWFRDFQVSPLKETFRAFGSPLYSMDLGPSWAQASDSSGGYFSGYGTMLPEQHFNVYGAGFSNLPPELGGQMSGVSRASGTPIE